MPFAFNGDPMAADNVQLKREELNFRKKELDAKLTAAGYDPATLGIVPNGNADVEKMQNQQTLQLAQQLQNKLAAQDTDKAISDYSTTGDATYLQKALDSNPKLKQAWSQRGVQQVANIDWSNDGKLLANHGFNPAEYDTPEKQDILKKNIYKTYDGKNWTVGLLNNVVAQTGAVGRMSPDQVQTVMDNHQQFRDFMSSPRSSANTAEGHKYETEIRDAAEATKVPANLIAAMMNVESNNNPNAVSNKGATGLMQLKPTTAQELGVKDITDPAQNILAGAQYMAKMLDKYNGNTRLALAAYNSGPTTVDKYGDVPPYAETQNYVQKIIGNYAAGESYYNAGKDIISSIKSDNTDSQKYADNRIATIQDFNRGNANAAKGETNINSDQEVANHVRALDLKDKELEQTIIKNIIDAKKNKNDATTGAQKDLAAAQQHTTDMVDNFGGEEQFFNTDFSDPKNFNKAYKDVVAINKLEGNTFSEEDKKNITNVRSLIALGAKAVDISDDTTGLIGNKLTNINKYLSDNVGGVEARSAYSAFSNTLLHAFGGSNMTPAEIERFTQAYGALGEQKGPVLAQFKTALGQIKSQIDSAASLSNPYTSKVLLGADRDKINKIIASVDNTLSYMEGLENPGTVNMAADKKKSILDNIFGGK